MVCSCGSQYYYNCCDNCANSIWSNKTLQTLAEVAPSLPRSHETNHISGPAPTVRDPIKMSEE